MIRRYRALLLLAGAMTLGAPAALRAQPRPVRAVLFYSPTCPHCHTVINEVLPAIFARYGGEPRFLAGDAGHVWANARLEVLLVDASLPAGYALFESSARTLRLPPEQGGVPRLVVGDSVLIGSVDIPAHFPGLIERLAARGTAWPSWPGLTELLPPGYATPTPPPRPAAARPADSAAAAPSSRGPSAPAALLTAERTEPTIVRTLRGDPVGASLALAVLATMLAALRWSVRRTAPAWPRAARVAVPVLVACGMVVAAYLSYVEASGVAAVCGPVGDCNAVQHSPFARILGVPVAVLGLAGYGAIMAAWLLGRRLAAFVLAVIGTLASAVLTFLEPFVIGAVCLWCLASAGLMTALMMLLAGPLARLDAGSPPGRRRPRS